MWPELRLNALGPSRFAGQELNAMAQVGKKSGSKDGTEIPQTILRSDKHAQDIWRETHDSAVTTYGEGGRAHRVAYAALKHQYEKKGDRWIKKAEKGPSDPQAARGPATEPKSTDEAKAPTAGGKVARTDKEARAKAKEARREDAQARRRRGS